MDQQPALNPGTPPSVSASVTDRVMTVLRGIRPAQSDGRPYDGETNLTDAGFTSMDMVKVMLGMEGAFDLMIPQDLITPDNFRSGQAIASMMARLAPAA